MYFSCFDFENNFWHIAFIFPDPTYIYKYGRKDLSTRRGTDAHPFGTYLWHGLGVAYSSQIAGQDAPEALPMPPLPQMARTTGWMSKPEAIDVNLCSSWDFCCDGLPSFWIASTKGYRQRWCQRTACTPAITNTAGTWTFRWAWYFFLGQFCCNWLWRKTYTCSACEFLSTYVYRILYNDINNYI